MQFNFYILLVVSVVKKEYGGLCVFWSMYLPPCACVCVTVCMSGFQSNVKESAAVGMGRVSEGCACLLIYVCVHTGKGESASGICPCVCVCVCMCA